MQIAVAAVQLQRAVDDRDAGVGGEALGHRRELGLVGRVGGDLGRRDVEQLPRRLQLGLHVGEHELGVLEVGDGGAELLALLGVFDRFVEAALARRRG